MKIAVSSDWHGMKPAERDRETISKCDLLLLCGDVFESHHHNEKLENYFRQLKSDGIRVVMTPGNHDFGIFYTKYPNEEIPFTRSYGCKKYPLDYLKSELGIDCLIDQGIELDGLKIYGTPWTPKFLDWAFMRDDNGSIKEKFDLIPNGLDILLCHGPYNNEKDPIDSCCPGLYSGQPDHLGSVQLFKTILEKQPRFFFCGHIHSASHLEFNVGKTICSNVSYLGEDYKPHYPIHVIEL